MPPALLGSCNDRAKQLHASPSGGLWIPPSYLSILFVLPIRFLFDFWGFGWYFEIMTYHSYYFYVMGQKNDRSLKWIWKFQFILKNSNPSMESLVYLFIYIFIVFLFILLGV